jgi:pilus assembly protein Flp/PilA
MAHFNFNHCIETALEAGGPLKGRQYNPRGNGMPLLAKFLKDESGATAIEYGLIAAGISVTIIVMVNTLGEKVGTTFTNVTTTMK